MADTPATRSAFRSAALRSVQSVVAAALMVSPFTPAASARTPQDADPIPFKQAVNEAIDRGVLHLRREQHRDGSWTGAVFGSYRAGPTAFAAYTLVESGVPPTDPSIRLALDYLRRNPPTMTYSAGAALLLLAEVNAIKPLAKHDKVFAEECLEKLIDWENGALRGTWAYPSGQVDLSNTQFAALGFWSADRLGLDVPLKTLQRMVQGTIEHHQEEPIERDLPGGPARGKSRAGKRKIAGYTYLPDGRDEPRSSMTVAGLCVHRIAARVAAKKLGGKVQKLMLKSERLGMAWLESNWTVTENVGTDPGTQVLYYLWGIERLAALLDTEKLFGHDWYREGAMHILDLEKDRSGSWGRLHETDYALLFLNRATRSVFSGTERASKPGSWELKSGPIQLRATGDMTLDAWITSVGEDLTIRRVEWFINGDPISTLDSASGIVVPESGRPKARIATRWESSQSGKVQLSVRLTGDRPGQEGMAAVPVVLESDELTVELKWTPEIWMNRAADSESELGPRRSLPAVSITASTSNAGQHPERAIDGLEGSAWRPSPGDEHPFVVLRFERPAKAEAIIISQPASSVGRVGSTGGVRQLAVSINGAEALVFEVEPESPGAIDLPLPKKVRVRTLRLEILDGTKGGPGQAGFAEIRLR